MEDKTRVLSLTVLADHNLEGQALLLWGTLASEGWLELIRLRLVTLAEVGLAADANDRDVWRYVQNNGLILLTGNRRMRGDDSLERTIRREVTPRSLPVLTVANVERLDERLYRERCASRFLEIVLDLDNYRGVGRIYIP
jgi:predicted nuclease of predicted toxin-antitoxin system